mmetsp:Transcript_7637/g.28767  ORF Transcript_7637/g.28767 Transcript_7637/m.28767 type:complete len:257 (-) Transcript_7637:118-888(-)|eukprot:scaffold8375_cov286-Pinguiococcus_pyrenoidosus.AAC.2
MATESCCPPDAWPGLKEDASREISGAIHTLDSGVVLYVVGAEDATNAIVIIHDVFGFSGGRVKSVCDSLAEETGALVIMPDLYGNEDTLDNYGGLAFTDEGKAWLQQCNWEKVSGILDDVYAFAEAKGAAKFGMLGFCWGCWLMFKAAATGKLAAGVGCHPSLHVGAFLYEDGEPAALAAEVKCPQLLLPSVNEPEYYTDGTLVKIINDAGHDAESVAFPDMQHGWTIRGDASDEAVARDVYKAVTLAKDWFAKYL